jgi:cell shape-determining protein MreC
MIFVVKWMVLRRGKVLKKRLLIILISLLLLVVVFQFSILQKTTARVSTSIYVNSKYSDKEPDYQFIEFSPQFGNYFVHYKTNTGEKFSIEVTPKMFPIIILYDPFDPPGP